MISIFLVILSTLSLDFSANLAVQYDNERDTQKWVPAFMFISHVQDFEFQASVHVHQDLVVKIDRLLQAETTEEYTYTPSLRAVYQPIRWVGASVEYQFDDQRVEVGVSTVLLQETLRITPFYQDQSQDQTPNLVNSKFGILIEGIRDRWRIQFKALEADPSVESAPLFKGVPLFKDAPLFKDVLNGESEDSIDWSMQLTVQIGRWSH